MNATNYFERARNLFSDSETLKNLSPSHHKPIEAAWAFVSEANDLFIRSPGNSEVITTSLALAIVYALGQDHLISKNRLPDTETVAQELLEFGMDDAAAVAMVSLALALQYDQGKDKKDKDKKKEIEKRDLSLEIATIMLSQSVKNPVKQWLVNYSNNLRFTESNS
jgi:hypothetical protein